MRRFAELSGFEGTEAEWQEEFQMPLCCKVSFGDVQQMILGKYYHMHTQHKKGNYDRPMLNATFTEKRLQQVLKLKALSSLVSDHCCI